MKKAMTIIAALTALFTLSAIAFAADDVVHIYDMNGVLMQVLDAGTMTPANIGSAIWSDSVYTYTADGSGIVEVIPNEPAFADISPSIMSDGCVTYTVYKDGAVIATHNKVLESRNLGPAIMADDYGTYTADSSGILLVYPNIGAVYEICVHENGDYHCACGFCAPCCCWN